MDGKGKVSDQISLISFLCVGSHDFPGFPFPSSSLMFSFSLLLFRFYFSYLSDVRVCLAGSMVAGRGWPGEFCPAEDRWSLGHFCKVWEWGVGRDVRGLKPAALGACMVVCMLCGLGNGHGWFWDRIGGGLLWQVVLLPLVARDAFLVLLLKLFGSYLARLSP